MNTMFTRWPRLRRASRFSIAAAIVVLGFSRPGCAQSEEEEQALAQQHAQIQAKPSLVETTLDSKTSPPGGSDLLPRMPSRSAAPQQPLETQGSDFGRNERPRREAADRVIEPPGEFQRFVEASTGQMLPIYGASLFDRVPSTFAPLDHVPVTPEYTVGPSDEVDVRVWGQINFNQRLVVDRAGDIFIPQVGRVSLAGLRFAQLHDTIQNAIGRVFRNFDVNVNLGQLRSIQVFVVGQARRPGSYTVSSLSTLVNALFASGGPSSRGSMRDIQLKRAGRVITHLDFYDLLLNGDKSSDVPLEPGDVIFIPHVGPSVAVSGSVETPAIYEMKGACSLGEVLAFAGGLSPVAAGHRAIIERVDQRSSLLSEAVDLDSAGLAHPLHDGDILQITSIVPRFANAVTIRGNVADPVRLPWRAGMKVSDAIPEKQALLTRDYWKERNSLQPAARIADSPAYRDVSLSVKGGDRSLAAAAAGDRAAVRREFIQKNDVRPPAPDIDWTYAAIERRDSATLASRLIPFNLAKALERDPSSDIPLEPGDVITIFSKADISTPRAQQSKFVRLEGEIAMAGVYSVEPGESLRALVARAGGLTPAAYLYGAQFTRESTRQIQQQRYNEFLDELERGINQSASTLPGRAVSGQQEQTMQTALASQRNLLERLRQTQATGRIVLQLQPDSRGVDALPDIPLEDGDRLLVPSIPATVSVVGTVYNQSSFLYDPALRLGNYLQDAGGPSRYADRSHIFVIRADGSVVAKSTRSGLFTAAFDSLKIYPGDAVIVPTDATKTTRLRNFLDWSQVIGNFGLGAAAVNVLK